MKEELLHYIWKTKSFPFQQILSTENIPLEVLNFGQHNPNSGPDFLEGKIKYQNTIWCGHIEIHIRSSDWILHAHQVDTAYDNVVLHVVWEEDEIIYRKDGTRIPCLELKPLIEDELLETYHRIQNRSEDLVCSRELQQMDHALLKLQFDKVAIERLEHKCTPISQELEVKQSDWSQILFFMVARSMGLPVNCAGMEEMARTIPINLIAKHSDNLMQLEALFFGQAGMFKAEWSDSYPQKLSAEFTFLREKYTLTPISGMQWKLMRMRPTSFPTIRISQLAALYHRNPALHSKILQARSAFDLTNLLDVEASEYWDKHYLFDKESAKYSTKKMGLSSKYSVIINAIVPFLFAYGQYLGDESMLERAIRFLEEIPAEKNKISKLWKDYSVDIISAFDSQAGLHLYKEYCQKKRCLECQFGNAMFKKISALVKEQRTQYVTS